MNQFFKQHIAKMFYVNLGKDGAQTLEMLRKVYNDDGIKQSQTFVWHKMLRECQESVKDDNRSGRPPTSQTDDSVQKVRQVLDKTGN